MIQNDSERQDTNQAYTKEDAYHTLEIIDTWISSLDTKVSYALALVGVLIGIVFSAGLPSAFQKVAVVSKLSELDGGEIIAVILVGLLYFVSFLSLVSFMLAIVARIKNLNNAPSIFFFGSISGMELQKYRDRTNQITEKEVLEELGNL